MPDFVLPVGSLVNGAAIIGGASIGMAFGRHFPERLRTLVFQALGLCTLVIGMQMGLKMANPLVIIFSLVLGGIVGVGVGLEDFLGSLGDRFKRLVRSDNSVFTDGLMTAFLLFAIGPMAVLGPFDEGLRADPTVLYTKSMLDGFASIALASSFGSGVLFSFIPLLIYQIGLTLLAGTLQPVFTPAVISEFSALGGVLILGIGINVMGLASIRLGDLLPSLVVVVVLATVFQ